jgi:surface polysaccharide O-acyltransferase-like enzyme
MTHISNTQNKKYSWIDVIRTAGAFFIILIHVSETYLDLNKSIDLVNWTSVVFWNSIPRTGVPLFIAVSGYVLLEKDGAIGKRIYNLLIPLAFWSLFYFLLALVLSAKSNPDFVKQLFIKSLLGISAFAPHLWFLYMLLGLYISLPLSRLLFRHLDRQGTALLCVAFVSNSLVSHITSMWNLFTGEQVESFYSSGLGWGNIYFGYFLLPKLIIDKKYFKIKDTYLWIGAVVSMLLVFSLTLTSSLKLGYFTKIWEGPSSIFILIQTFSIMLLLSHSENKIQKIFDRFVFLRKIVEISSRHALGIYAIHYFFIKLISYAINLTNWQQQSHDFLWLSIFPISIFVWLLSVSISIVASKNVLLNRMF